jgi:integrase
MRLLMGISKDRHGTYYARKKVPPALQEAVARVVGTGKARQTWLKRSLRTKDVETANRHALPVLMNFNRILDRAKELLAERPLRDGLTEAEIKLIAEHHYAEMLHLDDEETREGTGRDEFVRSIARQLDDAGVQYAVPIPPSERKPPFGLSESEVLRRLADLDFEMPIVREALATGDVSKISEHLDYLLNGVFGINLDQRSEGYRRLGMAVLRKHVAALEAIKQRTQGEPIETPPLPAVGATPIQTGETLSVALEGWKRDRIRSPRTLTEYEHAIKRFVELHGDMPVAQIRKSHARQFQEALQNVPIKSLRSGKLVNASLPELAQWGREHPDAQKIRGSTLNKLIGGVQSVCRWARNKGLVPDDWADPFADMRVGEDESDRAPFDTKELQAIFGTPVFTDGVRPAGGQGDAAFWLPLLALFTGARRGELTSLRASDVGEDELVGAVCIHITADAKAGKRLKTRRSARAVPVHSQLIEIGFLDYVAAQAKARGGKAWLFPQVAPGTTGAAAFSKWFGRYIGEHGVTDTAKVFHSFRHNFTDALRVTGVGEDVSRALVGHTQGGVHGRYGAKDMAARFRHRLAEAVASVTYNGLDLSRLTNHRTAQGRGRTGRRQQR